jgi:hypothetical protein
MAVAASTGALLPACVPKYVTDLVIPPPMPVTTQPLTEVSQTLICSLEVPGSFPGPFLACCPLCRVVNHSCHAAATVSVWGRVRLRHSYQKHQTVRKVVSKGAPGKTVGWDPRVVCSGSGLGLHCAVSWGPVNTQPL